MIVQRVLVKKYCMLRLSIGINKICVSVSMNLYVRYEYAQFVHILAYIALAQYHRYASMLSKSIFSLSTCVAMHASF
jgi:hypothetical protein